ncbi:MAG: hypothetical protein R2911_15825 [Caldilineaceae bacterium]
MAKPWADVTSANYGYSVGKFMMYGYLPIEHANARNPAGSGILWRTLLRHRDDELLFDPEMARLKG